MPLVRCIGHWGKGRGVVVYSRVNEDRAHTQSRAVLSWREVVDPPRFDVDAGYLSRVVGSNNAELNRASPRGGFGNGSDILGRWHSVSRKGKRAIRDVSK